MNRPLGRLLLLALVASLLPCASARSQERQAVQFQVNPGPLATGHSAYVLGDLPELGGNDLTRAVKLYDTGTGAGWQVTVSLPVNASYTFRYYDRAHDAAQVGNPQNGVAIGALQNGSTAVVPLAPDKKRMIYHSDIASPQLYWRQGLGAFTSVPMVRVGPGRTPAESRWEVAGFAAARRDVEFYVEDPGQTRRDPSAGSYDTPLDAFFLQDGDLFTYVPKAQVTAQRRDYNPASPPLVTSAILNNEKRPYRVMLPRGYDQHSSRRYPVLYAHDGFLWFDEGTASIDLDGKVLAELTRLGKIGEMIVVGVGHADRINPQVFFTNRYRDFIPPGDFGLTPWGAVRGEADRYVAFLRTELKPVIDARYRTKPGRDNTWTVGFSAGGVVSLYIGWDSSAGFARIGSFSGAFEVPAFLGRVASEPKRAIGVYLDAGTSNDYYPHALGVYDALIGRPDPWIVEGDLRFTYGLGHGHNTVDVAKRYPGFLTWLDPGDEIPDNQLLCGAVPYSTGLGGAQTLTLAWSGSTPVGFLDAQGAAPLSPGLLGIAIAKDHLVLGSLPPILIQLSPITLTLPLAFDGSGRSLLPFDMRHQALGGISLYTQAFELRGGSAFGSGGLQIRMCR